MNYQICIDYIRDLGFGDDQEIAEFQDVVPNAINLAISFINDKVPGAAPRNEQYDFTIEEGETEPLYLDMEDIDETFMDFAQTAMLYDNGTGYRKFTDYDIINESTIVIDPVGHVGDFRVLYKVEHERFTGTEAQLREELPLARRVHHLVPILAAHYVWLEDDPAKAEEYKEEFKEKVSIMEEERIEKPRGRFVGGGI